MKSKILPTVFCLVLSLCIFPPIAILVFYHHYLGPISHNPSDWGQFGSLLSGIFGLLSAAATLATLTFLAIQQKKQDKVIEHQRAALTFDQYLKHRNLFEEKLKYLESSENNKIKFSNPDALYTDIFPNNSPTHCDYKVNLTTTNSPPKSLPDLCAIYLRIKNCLEARSTYIDIIQPFIKIQEYLGILYVGEKQNGDIIFKKINTGLNLYNLPQGILRIERTLNALLFYTGNTSVISLTSHITQLVRDMIFEKTTTDRHYKVFYPYYNTQAIEAAHILLIAASKLSRYRAATMLTGHLQACLKDTESLKSLCNQYILFKLCAIAEAELAEAEEKVTDEVGQLHLKKANEALASLYLQAHKLPKDIV